MTAWMTVIFGFFSFRIIRITRDENRCKDLFLKKKIDVSINFDRVVKGCKF